MLKANREWAQRMVGADPQYFARLELQQAPRYLWIGCSDSRVPANQITGQPPGEVFVHRNIANQVHAGDANALAVLQYAVGHLKIAQIIVCGHYGCSGIRAAQQYGISGPLDSWLQEIREIASRHAYELAALPDEKKRHNRLCELNVHYQVLQTANTAPVQDAWRSGQSLALHGWVYTLSSGIITDLGITLASAQDAQKLSALLYMQSRPGMDR